MADIVGDILLISICRIAIYFTNLITFYRGVMGGYEWRLPEEKSMDVSEEELYSIREMYLNWGLWKVSKYLWAKNVQIRFCCHLYSGKGQVELIHDR